VPQLIRLWGLSRDQALRKVHGTANDALSRDRILCRRSLDADDGNARVFGAAIMLAVTEVTQPGLERRRVVFANNLAVGLDGCMAADRCPLARGCDEGDVYARVRAKVVRLAGFGVGVEEEVEAVALLYIQLALQVRPIATDIREVGGETYLGCESHSSGSQQIAVGSLRRQHAVLCALNKVE
jgi:hypothetical protein